MKKIFKNACVAASIFFATSMNYVCGEMDLYGKHCGDTCNYVDNFCSGKGFLRADVLYLRAQEGGFNCGCLPDTINNYIGSDQQFLTKTLGESKDPRFKWNAGFRLGAGYTFEEQSWDVGAYWTHYQTTNGHGNNGSSSGSNSLPSTPTIATPTTASSSESDHFHWNLNFNVIDLLFSRDFYAGCFTFKPILGVRFAQIHQHVKAATRVVNNTFNGSGSLDDTPVGAPAILYGLDHNKQKFRGVGPVFGLEGIWDVGCGWSLFAGVAVSTLYGRFDSKFEGSDVYLNGTNICNQHTRSNSCQFATDAALGVRWKMCYCEDIDVTFQLALEQHRYFDHNRLGDYGDLCLDGGSFSASVSY